MHSRRLLVHGKTPTQFKNYHLVTRDELATIKEEITSCITQYGLSTKDFVITSVEISKRLKTTAGNISWPRYSESYKIALAYNNYREFGFESMIKTLRHEMAHLIEYALHGETGHSDRFKEICQALGGSMNPKLAGKKYSDSASSDYCRTQYKYSYTCSCGMSFSRKKKITSANTLRARCRTCRTMVMDMKMEVL